ncbi:MAG: TolC family outer membrane protein, partial [Panacagrimonas sp.]
MMRALPVLLLATIAASGAPARAADLLEVYRAAQTSDAVYAGARASWSAGQEKLPQGRSGLL